ncbi:MAG: tRNA (guanosine(37)-N1)-methyltransferase TrmD [Gammaproteobacteria bacterium]|nr:tRNA (guanosine(37)-N1)-methyltransferase TrmD [Gammaproteobacteria bacterium]
MRIHVISIFPAMYSAVTEEGVTARAFDKGLLELAIWNPRDFTADVHRSVDDRPYGGGPGMVMTAQPLADAVEAARADARHPGAPVIYMSPQGSLLDQKAVERYAALEEVILVAGRYEGVDERFIQQYVDEECSIGDYVLSGGELASMVWIDAVARLQPGALGNEDSAGQDSFNNGLLDCGHYTRPERFGEAGIPPVLLSGDHAAIRRWRLKSALGRTWLRRPDLLREAALTREMESLLEEFKREFEAEKQ